MAIDKTVLKTPRFILRAVELVFSILVLALAAAYINKAGSDNNVNFSLFVGLTSMLICGVFVAMELMGKAKDKTFIVIELVLTILYWIFWLSAAAAVSSTTSWVNSLSGDLYGSNCETITGVYLGRVVWYCNVIGAAGIVRADCAFCWLTWFAWSGSLFFCIYHDVMKDKVLSSKKGAAATEAPAAADAPAATTTEAVADAAAKV